AQVRHNRVVKVSDGCARDVKLHGAALQEPACQVKPDRVPVEPSDAYGMSWVARIQPVASDQKISGTDRSAVDVPLELDCHRGRGRAHERHTVADPEAKRPGWPTRERGSAATAACADAAGAVELEGAHVSGPLAREAAARDIDSAAKTEVAIEGGQRLVVGVVDGRGSRGQ